MSDLTKLYQSIRVEQKDTSAQRAAEQAKHREYVNEKLNRFLGHPSTTKYVDGKKVEEQLVVPPITEIVIEGAEGTLETVENAGAKRGRRKQS